jgi:integrase
MSVYKDEKTGKWFYTFRQNGKQIKKRGFRTKREATLAEAKARNEKPKPETMTLDELYELWMEAGKGLKITTRQNRERVYRKQIQPLFGSHKLNTIDSSAIKAWQDNLSSQIKISSVNTYRRTFKALMLFAVKGGYLSSNPFDLVPTPKEPKKLDDPSNFWEPSEYHSFMDKRSDSLYAGAYQLIWLTGMRAGEALALQWKNVDFDRRYIRVVASYVRNEMLTPKTENSIRKIYMQKSLYDLLIAMYEKAKKQTGFNQGYYVLGDIRPLKYITLQHNFQYDVRQSGVKYITLHGLRHSHASLLIDSGANDTLVAERLGHTVEMLHQVYAHVYKHKRKEFENTLDKIL